MRRIFTGVTLILGLVGFASGVYAISETQYENSDPYISLASDKEKVRPKEEFEYTITFGNKGPGPARNLIITLNVPMDGRAPLLFISADPQPSSWLSSEFGNLPEFSVSSLQSYEATEEGKIKVRVMVRDSAADQAISATASLQAPRREMGKRLVVSESALTTIAQTAVSGVSTAELLEQQIPSGAASISATPEPSLTPEDQPEATSPPEPGSASILLASESVWTSLFFLGTAALLVLAFIAGMKSKTV